MQIEALAANIKQQIRSDVADLLVFAKQLIGTVAVPSAPAGTTYDFPTQNVYTDIANISSLSEEYALMSKLILAVNAWGIGAGNATLGSADLSDYGLKSLSYTNAYEYSVIVDDYFKQFYDIENLFRAIDLLPNKATALTGLSDIMEIAGKVYLVMADENYPEITTSDAETIMNYVLHMTDECNFRCK